jgi:membrane-associated phospholipid phosphatase
VHYNEENMINKLSISFIVIILMIPLVNSVLAQEELTPERAINDLGGWLSSPFRGSLTDYAWTGATLGACGLCYAYDKPWSDKLRELDKNPNIHGTSKALSMIGQNWVVISCIGAFGVTGLIIDDRDIIEEAWVFGESVGYTAVLTELLKYGTGRERPFQNKNAYNFHGPGHDFDSFPSGHATATGALVGCIAHRHPDSWVIIPVAAFASGIGLSRLTLGKHYPSDVVVGFALGFWGGYCLGKPFGAVNQLGFDDQGRVHIGFSVDIY